MAKNQPNDYLSNANLLEEILKSQAVQAKLPEEHKWTKAAECLTPALIVMLNLLVERIATGYRWRNYTWIDDMKAEAMFGLCRVCLKFDLSKVPEGSYANPFAYQSQIITRIFLTIIDREKNQGRIRDQIIEMSDTDLLPSFARQNENVSNSLGMELDGTKRVKSDPHKRRRRKKAKVLKEDDTNKMTETEEKDWLIRKVEEFKQKQSTSKETKECVEDPLT
jgi:hypothetical protein